VNVQLAYQWAYRDATAYQRIAQIKHDAMAMWQQRLLSYPTPIRKLQIELTQNASSNATYWAMHHLGTLLGCDLLTDNVEGC
jgi:hypothetical protein